MLFKKRWRLKIMSSNGKYSVTDARGESAVKRTSNRDWWPNQLNSKYFTRILNH